MLVIAARVAKVHFPVLNDRIRPVGDIQRAVGAKFYVDRAEIDVGGSDKIGQLFRDIGRILGRHREPNDAVSAKVAGDHVALPRVGKLLGVDDFQTAKFRVTARADAAQRSAGAGIGHIHGAWNHVIDTLTPSAVRGERLTERIDLMPPRIDESAHMHAEGHGRDVESEDAAAV